MALFSAKAGKVITNIPLTEVNGNEFLHIANCSIVFKQHLSLYYICIS